MRVTVDGLKPIFPLQKHKTVSLQLQVPRGRRLESLMFTLNVLITDGSKLHATQQLGAAAK